MVLLLTDTGVQVSEATALRVKDTDLSVGRIRVRHGMGGEEKEG